jgi:signal transduction histidine kinase
MVKYSGADKAMFSIKKQKTNLVMIIRDNGKGFDRQHHTTGNGLKNIIKRSNEMDAQLAINTTAGNGTTIELKVPV